MTSIHGRAPSAWWLEAAWHGIHHRPALTLPPREADVRHCRATVAGRTAGLDGPPVGADDKAFQMGQRQPQRPPPNGNVTSGGRGGQRRAGNGLR